MYANRSFIVISAEKNRADKKKTIRQESDNLFHCPRSCFFKSQSAVVFAQHVIAQHGPLSITKRKKKSSRRASVLSQPELCSTSSSQECTVDSETTVGVVTTAIGSSSTPGVTPMFSQPLPLVSLPELSAYDLFIDSTHGLVICVVCQHAVHPSGTRQHIVQVHHTRGVPLQDAFDDVFSRHNIKDGLPMILPDTIVRPIVGIKVQQGFTCMIPNCHEVMVSDRSMARHFQLSHRRHMAKQNSCPCNVQVIYPSRKDQMVIQVNPHSGTPIKSSALEAFLAAERQRPPLVETNYHLPTNSHEVSNFLSSTGWHIPIEGCNVNDLITITAFPDSTDTLWPVAAAFQDYLKNIAQFLPRINVLFRRLVASPTTCVCRD
jgi:Orsellinic acid/F9775 biosynthesis cluster protein D